MADDTIPDIAIDHVDDRATTHGLRLGVSEITYSELTAAAVAHATRAPVVGDPTWAPIGPRNVGGRITAFAQDISNPQVIYAGSAHGGLWISRDAGDTWSHVGKPQHNFPIGSIAIVPGTVETVIVGTGSMTARYVAGVGLMRVEMRPKPEDAVFTTLAGAPGLGSLPGDAGLEGSALRYTRIRFDPDNPERFWVASQTGLWRFEPTETPKLKRDFPIGTNDPTGAPAFATSLPLTTTWPDYCTDLLVARDPRKDSKAKENGRDVLRYLVLYVAVSGAGIFRGRFDREDKTIEWDSVLSVPNAPLYPGGQAFGRVRMALCEERPSTLYAVFESNPGPNPAFPPPAAPQNFPEQGHASFVFRSDDNGDAWTARGRIPRAGGYSDGATPADGQADYCLLIEVDPSNADILVCGEIDVCQSTDGGNTWVTILDWQNYDLGDYSQHADQHIALFDRGDHRKLWVGNDGGLSLARDLRLPPQSPRYWRKRSHGIIAGQFQDVTVHPTLTFMCGGGLQDNGSYASVGGATWMHVGFADGGSVAFHTGQPEHIFVGQDFALTLATISGTPFSAAVQGLVNPTLADLPLADQRQFVRVSGVAMGPTANSGPFVGILEQDPTTPGQFVGGWTVSNTDSLGYIVAPPTAPPLADPLLLAPAVGAPIPNLVAVAGGGLLAAGEDAEAIALSSALAGGTRVEGWIGTSNGRLVFSRTASQPATWALAPAQPPLIGGVPRVVTRISVHPNDSFIVAVATVPDIQGQTFPPTALAALSSDVVIKITAPGAVGTSTFSFDIGGAGPTPGGSTAATVVLPGTLTTVFFAPGNYANNDTWTIKPDGTTTPAGSNTSPVVAATPSIGGRIYVTYDRGTTWADVTAPTAPLPRPNPDLLALSPGPIGALEWDRTVPNSTRLFAGTLGGVYALSNIPSSTALALAAPPPNIQLTTSIQLQANLTMTAGGPIDVTRAVDWSVAPGGVLNVSPTGLVTIAVGVGVGNAATVTATRGLLTASALITVAAAPGAPVPAPGAPAAFAPPTVPVAWRPFGNNIPLTLINDLTTIPGSTRLRAATFGRGIWDVDLAGGLAHRLYIRQTVIEDGRSAVRVLPTIGTPATPLLDPRLPQTGANRFAIDFTHAYDIRVDAAPHSFFDDVVDGVEFDERIAVDDAVPFEDNYVYVQVNSTGVSVTEKVDVFLFARLSPSPAPHGVAPVAIPALGNVSDIYPPADAAKPVAPWVRIGESPTKIEKVGPAQPVVARFTWSPDDTFANQDVALVAMCTSTDDALPNPLAHGASFTDFITNEPRAALRIVHVGPRPRSKIYIRDGVADDTRLGGYPVGGRSPDIMIVSPADITVPPEEAFKDHIARRSADKLSGTDPNFIYVRVHNRRRFQTSAEVKVFAIDLDDENAPQREPGFWTELPIGGPSAVAVVPPLGVGYAKIAFPGAAEPNFLFTNKTVLLLALIRSIDDQDPLPNKDRVDSVDSFWELVSKYVDSDNAAARAVPWFP